MNKTAIYDNPATFCREWWLDGRMMEHISAELLYSKAFQQACVGTRFYLNVDKNFIPGKITGDREAIAPNYLKG